MVTKWKKGTRGQNVSFADIFSPRGDKVKKRDHRDSPRGDKVEKRDHRDSPCGDILRKGTRGTVPLATIMLK